MFWKLKTKHEAINLNDLNNLLLIISLITLGISLFCTRNIYVIILIFLFIYEIYYHHEKNKYTRFLTSILPIIIFACFLMRYLNLSFFKFDILNVVKIFINILIFLDYFLIVFKEIKSKELKYIKRGNRKRTFNDLRIKKINSFKNANIDCIADYQKEHNIDITSDYYKVIKENLNDKIKTDLEEYVWLNYLRFYKNKKYNKSNIFDTLNIVFILIHVIILLLSILVR